MNIEDTEEYIDWAAAKAVELDIIAHMNYAAHSHCSRDEFKELVLKGVAARAAEDICVERLQRRRAADVPPSTDTLVAEELVKMLAVYTANLKQVADTLKIVGERLTKLENAQVEDLPTKLGIIKERLEDAFDTAASQIWELKNKNKELKQELDDLKARFARMHDENNNLLFRSED